jgi:hypothetical protein
VIELDPADLDAYNNLDTAHAMRGEIDRVVGLWEKILETGRKIKNQRTILPNRKR